MTNGRLIIILAFFLFAGVIGKTFFVSDVNPPKKRPMMKIFPASHNVLGTNNSSRSAQASSSPTLIPMSVTPNAMSEATPIKSDFSRIFSQMRYPNSVFISNNNSSLTLVSSDDSQAITNWYKNTMKRLGYRITSFAEAKTNGVQNKLVGVNAMIQVSIELTKHSNGSLTTISVSLATTP